VLAARCAKASAAELRLSLDALVWGSEPGACPLAGWDNAQTLCRVTVCQAGIASRTLAVSTNCSKRTMWPPRTMKWWATRTLMSLPVALLVAV
jgi:hypothetical protein